jgi:hypothetical protein
MDERTGIVPFVSYFFLPNILDISTSLRVIPRLIISIPICADATCAPSLLTDALEFLCKAAEATSRCSRRFCDKDLKLNMC